MVHCTMGRLEKPNPRTYPERYLMHELDYPFDPILIMERKRSLRRDLLNYPPRMAGRSCALPYSVDSLQEISGTH